MINPVITFHEVEKVSTIYDVLTTTYYYYYYYTFIELTMDFL